MGEGDEFEILIKGRIGSSSAFVHACRTYIWCACTSAWKLAPQGLIPFTMLFFYLNTTNRTL